MCFLAYCTIIALAFGQSEGLQCYSGFKSWGGAPPAPPAPPGTETTVDPNALKLVTCAEDEDCCSNVDSLPGSSYRCEKTTQCPHLDKATGKNCSSQLDVAMCYCRDHTVSDCIPYEFKKSEETSNEVVDSHEEAGHRVLKKRSIDENSNTNDLKCYQGTIKWGTPGSATVPLKRCQRGMFCCVKTSSLPGIIFDCSSTCPDNWSQPCGPQGDDQTTDSNWCYCRDHTDEKCHPENAED